MAGAIAVRFIRRWHGYGRGDHATLPEYEVVKLERLGLVIRVQRDVIHAKPITSSHTVTKAEG